jgi:hypothetical protein
MKAVKERTTDAIREDDSDLSWIHMVALTGGVKTNTEDQDVTTEVESHAEPPLNEDNPKRMRLGVESNRRCSHKYFARFCISIRACDLTKNRS